VRVRDNHHGVPAGWWGGQRVSYGPVLNCAAVALTAFGNVPVERAGTLIEILYGQQVSAGFVDRASARLAQQLGAAGFGAAMRAALLAEPVLTADESPVEVVRPAADPQTGQPVAGSPHVMVIRTPDERLVWLIGLVSRGYDTVIAGLRSFAGHLIVDGYGAYQRLLTGAGAVLAGIQQCCAHVMRRARAVAKLGPGTLQPSWTGKATAALTEAHAEVEAAKARRQTAVDPDRLAELRERYDQAVDTGIIHNRHRDWDGEGNHPAFVLATWLKTYAEQVWHFTGPLRCRLDLQRRRTRRQTRQATSSRFRVLADQPDPGPMVPGPVLSHLSPQPRPDHPGRHHPRPSRPPVATQTSRSVARSLTGANP